MISYYWPPCGGPGSLRPVKFAKYLPDFGIEPIILTRKNIAYHTLDTDLKHEIRSVQTIETESLDPARLLYRFGMRRYKPRVWQRPIKQGLNFPDHKLPWFPFAVQAGRKIVFDSIYVTAPPFSAFLIAHALAYAGNKPLILDFRDSWLKFPFMPYKGLLQRSLVRLLEDKITHAAQGIITVDDNIKYDLVQRYPDISARVTVIPNGYDPDDFTRVERPGIFTLTYLGTVRAERNPEPVLRAAEKAINTNKIDKMHVNFIGHIEEPYPKLLKKYPFVHIHGHIPYRRALQEFARSHGGLMITTGSTFFFPSRQNEYLASGLPIVVCGRSRGMHMLEKAFQQGYPGWVYEYNDINGMAKRIGELYRAYKNGTLIQGQTPYTHYTRKNLTRQLADIMKKTLNTNI